MTSGLSKQASALLQHSIYGHLQLKTTEPILVTMLTSGIYPTGNYQVNFIVMWLLLARHAKVSLL
ncbi:hypothetical protein PSEUDO8O_30377 [Pseudomonas sp. 8O]|nr:hypothetical protein PSEUDO8O_30377 [Pseudomonas sp. 8O]